MALLYPISCFKARQITVIDADGISKRPVQNGDLVPVYVAMTSQAEYPQILTKAHIVIVENS